MSESEAMELVERICDMAEDPDLPERAADFAESVSEKARDIGNTIEESGVCTEGQYTALENMERGLSRWFR